ncbi:MAG TPA: zf-HC2 domain-containing protein [Blastocatellia bacterium]|nr:zf-HC2 domain-containing protein [Blastocatellia bacterium]
MECRAVINSLSEYLDGQGTWVSENEKRSIDEHLDACPTCQILKLELTEIKTAARELPLYTPPRAMWVRIANTLEAELPASERKTREEFPKETWWERFRVRQFTFSMPQMAGAGALAMALIVVGIYGLSGQSPKTDPTRLSLTSIQTAVLPDEDQIKAELNRRLVEVNKLKAGWNAQSRGEFEKHLTQIEESLEKCRIELRANPDDKAQQQTLRNLYNEKRQLIENAERSKQ